MRHPLRLQPILGLVTALCALLAGAVSCSTETKLRSLCSSDAQCIAEHDGNPNWACDSQLGDCVCTADEACVGDNEYCELRPAPGDGRCHPKVTCEWNQDCEGQTFCDLQDHFCRLTGCTDDLQCDLGELCDPVTRTCVQGCKSHGDCNLGDVCLCQDEQGNAAPCTCEGEDRSNCQVGVCAENTCADKTFCKYGELCVDTDGPGGELPTCVLDERGPYCGACTISPGNRFARCDSLGPNFCLIDSSDPAGVASFCGVDCSDGQECPNGMSCHDVLILTDAVCRSDSACVPKPGAPSCASVDDCPAGSQCVNGKCAGRCAVGEGGQSGFCSCVQDSDCPQQACGTDGYCEITRERCTPGQNDTCRNQIFCVNNGEIGYCQIGRNCAPDEGITCTDVRCDQNPAGCE